MKTKRVSDGQLREQVKTWILRDGRKKDQMKVGRSDEQQR